MIRGHSAVAHRTWAGLAVGIIAALAWGWGVAWAQPPITVDPQACCIVLPETAGPVHNAAAAELQKHLALITGVEAPIVATDEQAEGYRFFIGVPSPDDDRPPAPEEARWVIAPQATWLFGDDDGHLGSQFAVYGFLEDQLGVRWLAPGDGGIAYERRSPITLTAGAFSWAPVLEQRGIRPNARPGQYPQPRDDVMEFWGFARGPEEHDRYAADVRAWQLRMRMGSHTQISYGHAFTDWWDRYGETHPEYFALNRWGQRGPEPLTQPQTATPAYSERERQNVKLCVSNPAVAEQIVADWVAGGMRRKWINVCENDLDWGFCRCANCMALDVPREGEQFGAHLSDRYVYLTNAVARLAREYDPEAGAVMYAYNAAEEPPRRERVEPNVVVGIVPTTVDLDELEQLYGGWAAMGATRLFHRPNLPLYYHSMAIPIGAERQMFEVLQLAIRHGAVVADYDSLTGMWPVCGMADYVLARAMSDPERPFEYWEEHYCAGFGAAAPEVARYFRYWREELWERRLLPDLGAIVTRGKYYNFARGLMWSLGDYYRAEDFDATDAILQEAAARDLEPAQRAQLDQLILANQHARLTFNAIATSGIPKFEHSRALLEFRTAHRDDLALAWLGLFANETRFGDITGLKTASALREYPLPWVPTALAWRFKLDPDEVGLDEGWQNLGPEEMDDWELMRTDFHWENPYDGETYPSAELRARLKGYDGIGWYATEQSMPAEFADREIYLYFGAVDESCWVYVNGQLAGEHIFAQANDWNTPFAIRIDPFLDPERDKQRITVRVEDRSGAGGIWKRVWLVSRLR